MLRIMLALAVGLAATAAAQAYEWNPVQKKMFMDDCAPACQKNDKVAQSKKYLCEAYCNCVMQNGQEQFSATDYETMDDDARAGRTTDKIREFQKLFPLCGKRAFGN